MASGTNINALPASSWDSNWELRPTAWSSSFAGNAYDGFRTLGEPGHITAHDPAAAWSLHLGDNRATSATSRLFCNGLHLSFTLKPRPIEAFAFATGPRTLRGFCSDPLRPVLFSPEEALSEKDGCVEASAGGVPALLLLAPANGGVDFCLTWGHATPAQREAKAREGLAIDIHDELKRQVSLRRALAEPPFAGSSGAARAARACERLARRLRPPADPFPARWSSTDVSGQEVFDINTLLPLVHAWSLIDIAVAEELVHSALSARLDSGLIPARSGDRYTAFPLIAQAARIVAQSAPDGAFASKVAPIIEVYLKNACAHYGLDAEPVPLFPTQAESLLPEAFEQGLASVGLCAWLLAEIAAYDDLAAGLRPPAKPSPALSVYRQKLRNALINFFWDRASRRFADRLLDGTSVARQTAGLLMPLLLPDLDRRYRESTVLLFDQFLGYGCAAIPAWAPWNDDPRAPPVRAIDQYFALEGLRRNRYSKRLKAFVDTLRDGILSQQTVHRAGSPAASQNAAADEAAVTAALELIIYALAPGTPDTAATVSPLLQRLDRHRYTVTAGVLAGCILIISAVVLGYSSKRRPPASTMEGIYGLARQYYEAGEYEDTAALCAELLDVAPGYKAPRLLLAHTRFRQGDYAQAETLYRDFVEHGPDKPRARLNLALTLYRQGHVEQSRTVYSNFINENASQHPALVIRARTALALLDEQTGNATSPVNGMLEDGR